MPHLTTSDGSRLYYEETGQGAPIIFVHEFAGDHRSWEPQVRWFARRYRCITYNARGYPPSDVPGAEHYSQARARDDIRDVLDALQIDRAHVVGLSMGGFATLHFGFAYPQRALSLVVAGCGYGAEPDLLKSRIIAEEFARTGIARPMGGQGISMLVPTLLELGTPEQKEAYIRPTLHGEMIWCQGYSEPGAGSDLAARRHDQGFAVHELTAALTALEAVVLDVVRSEPAAAGLEAHLQSDVRVPIRFALDEVEEVYDELECRCTQLGLPFGAGPKDERTDEHEHVAQGG